MSPSLTPGTERCLEHAAQLGREQGFDEAQPLQLLWAIRLQHNAASELLDHFGVDRQRLEELAAAYAGVPDHRDANLQSVRQTDIRQILGTARSLLRQSGESTEIGTPHLLLGLTIVDSLARDLLAVAGIVTENLKTLVFPDNHVSGPPIAVDFDLQSSGDPQLAGDPRIEVNPQTDSEPHTPIAAESLPSATRSLRILDAAANRAREGLRVVEDYVRFGLDDAQLSRLLKQCRHDLADALKRFDAENLIRARDTRNDVGTSITTPAEQTRTTERDVVVANLKRTQEALRTLEEFGKLESAAAGADIESIRYRHYSIEQAIMTNLNARAAFSDRRLYVLLTEAMCRQPWQHVLEETLAGGASVIQLREKQLPDRELLARARIVRQATRDVGALFVMNDRPDLAVLAEADAVHVGQDELTAADVRRIVGPRMLVGISTHSIDQAQQAVNDGADYLGIGPVFSSSTKTFTEAELGGIELVQSVRATVSLPTFAIGGITHDNLRTLTNAGSDRIAVSHAVCGTDQVREATESLLRMLLERES